MTGKQTPRTPQPGAIARRSALLLPLAALSGCSMWDGWFGSDKVPLPGKRFDVMPPQDSLTITPGRTVTVPPPLADAGWPQPGGSPAHAGGNLAETGNFARVWSSDIGAGTSYRRRITAQPVVAGGMVFAMDSAARVSAWHAESGRSVWDMDTQSDDNRSTNVGGGIATDAGTLYAATGRADVLALEAATGKLRWRVRLPAGARSAPTVLDGRLFIPTLDDRLVALSTKDGSTIWSYQAPSTSTSVLGLPAPASADAIVVAGFATGDLQAVRATSGTVLWADSLAAARGRSSLADLSTIRAMPLIRDGRLYAIGLGGLMLAIDLRTGRRLWEREVASGNTPWLAGDWLYVLTTENQLTAISGVDGAVAWVSQLERFGDPKKSADPIHMVGPVMAGGRLVLVDSTGHLLVFDPVTGKQLARQEVSGAGAVAPVVAMGMVFLVTVGGSLVALR
jgi:outer membrane protein assembly factor BamB